VGGKTEVNKNKGGKGKKKNVPVILIGNMIGRKFSLPS
jgi:hypothetical protein